MQCIKHVEAPVVSSQGLTSMMISDLVSLAFSAPRFLAAAMRASFSSFAFCSSCRNNCYSQKPVEVCMGHGTQPHDSSSVLQDLLLGVLRNLAHTLDRQCDGICIPSAWFISVHLLSYQLNISQGSQTTQSSVHRQVANIMAG